jgi:hypothetical protein
LTLATLVELGLLWAFASKLGGVVEFPGKDDAASEAINVIHLSSVRETVEDPAPRASSQDSERHTLRPDDVDVSAETELPPPEWAIVRLPPQAQSGGPPRPATRSEGAGTASAAGGAGVYDPFAGAAPMQAADLDATAVSPGGFALDGRLLAELVRRAARVLRSPRGSVEIVVQVSAVGIVVAARTVGGTADADDRAAIAQALVGESLFRPPRNPPSARLLRLPPINLG